MADAEDSKSSEGNFVWVQLPPPAPQRYFSMPASPYLNVGEMCTCQFFRNVMKFHYSLKGCYGN